MKVQETIDSMKVRLNSATKLFQTISGVSSLIQQHSVQNAEVHDLLIQLKTLATGLLDNTQLYIIACTNSDSKEENNEIVLQTLINIELEIKCKIERIYIIIKNTKASST